MTATPRKRDERTANGAASWSARRTAVAGAGSRARLGAVGRSLVRTVAWFAVVFVILYAYSWFRKSYFVPPPAEGYANALDIIELQRRLGISVARVELPLQAWAMESDWAIDFFNLYYRNFKSALYLGVLLRLILQPRRFMPIFRIFLVTTAIALPMYVLYPLAPPRLMQDYGYAFVDTLAVFSGVQSSAEGAGGANQFAAMPSMHIGWSTVAAMWLAAALPWRRIGLALGVIHVMTMCVVVMATANHYLLDIVAGFAVVAVAVVVARIFPSQTAGIAFLRRRVSAATEGKAS